MNFDNILPFCEFSPLPFDCCEESMQFANFCSNYEPLWFLPVLTSDGVLSLLQNEFASLRQPAHYAVQRYGIIISSRSLLPRRLRSRRRRSNSFPQKIRIPQPVSRLGDFDAAWQANGTFTYAKRRTPPEGEVLRSLFLFEQTSLVKAGVLIAFSVGFALHHGQNRVAAAANHHVLLLGRAVYHLVGGACVEP